MKKALLIMILLLCYYESYSQKVNNQNQYGTADELIAEYSSGKIVNKESFSLNGKNLMIYKDRITFQEKKTNEFKTIPIEDIILVSAKTGTYWLEGMLLGGLGGFLLGINNDITHKNSNRNDTFYFTIIGSCIGLIAGLFIDNYKTIFHTGDFFLSTDYDKYNIINKGSNYLTIVNFQIQIN